MILTRIHDGRIFPSMSAADRALGVSIGTVAAHIDRNGSTDRIGKPYRTSGRAISYLGVDYPTITAASLATGHSRDKIYWSMQPKKRKPKPSP